MKKYFILTGLVLLPLQLLSKNAALFSYDRARVQQTLLNATMLDQHVSAHHIQIHRIDPTNPLLANFKAGESFPVLKSNPPLGVPGFFWGCILGLPGVLIVYLTTSKKSEKEGVLVGCLLHSALMALIIIDMFQSTEKNIGETGIADAIMSGCI